MTIIIIMSLCFAPMAFASVEPWARALLEIGFFVIAAASLKKSKYVYLSKTNTTLLPALLAVAAVGLLQLLTQTPVSGLSPLRPFTSWRPATMDGVLLWLSYAALVFAAVQAFQKKYQIKYLLRALFVTGIIISFMGIFQKTGNETLVYGFRKISTYVPPFGPFVNRDNAANYLMMTGLCGLSLFLAGFTRYERFVGLGKKFDFLAKQALIAVMLGMNVYGLIFTGSRGGINAFFISALLLVIFTVVRSGSEKHRLAKFLILTAVSAALYSAVIIAKPQFIARQAGEFERTVTIRFSMYESGLAMFKDFPVFGTGLNSLVNSFGYYQDRALVEGVVEHAHCDWLEMLLTTGIIGFLAFLSGFALLLVYSTKTLFKIKSKEKTIIYSGILAAVSGFCIHAFVDFPLQIPANAYTFLILAALLGSRSFEKSRTDFDEDKRILTRSKHFAAAAPVCLALAALAVPSGISDYLKLEASVLALSERAPVLASAFGYHPTPQKAYSLAITYYNMAVKNPEKRRENLTLAMGTILAALHKQPADQALDNLRTRTADFIRYDRANPYKPVPAKPTDGH